MVNRPFSMVTDWLTRMRGTIDDHEIHQSFRSFVRCPTHSNFESFAFNSCPLVYYIIRTRVSYLVNDYEDICSYVMSELYFSLSQPEYGRCLKFTQRSFSQYFYRIIDYTVLRYAKLYKRNRRQGHPTRRPKVTSPLSQLILKEELELLPKKILRYICRRNRFGYPRYILEICVNYKMKGKSIPSDMLVRWFKIHNPEHLRNFVTIHFNQYMVRCRKPFFMLLFGYDVGIETRYVDED